MTVELMPRSTSQDVSGFALFSQGDEGEAHVMAHRMLDEGRHELGHRLLGDWLGSNDGSGSCWTHLQWHMGVFELAVGQWDAALSRFEREILPVIVSSQDALTDGPAMLWRLTLAAPRPVDFDWEPVRNAAARQLAEPCDAYVELHCLLALAGAGDRQGLDRWMKGRRAAVGPKSKVLTAMGAGLRAFAAGDFRLAAPVLASAAPQVSLLGGSQAQNELFREIAELSWTRSQQSLRAA